MKHIKRIHIKGIIFFLSVLFLILFASPLIIGIWFENNYRNLIENINQRSDIKVQIIDYQRNWWSTNVTLQVFIKNIYVKKILELLSSDNAFSNLTLAIHQHIQHGPLFFGNVILFPNMLGIVSIESLVQLSPKTDKWIFSLVQEKNILQIDNILTSFTGNYLSIFEIFPLQINSVKENFILKFDGGNGKGWITPKTLGFSGKIVTKKIDISFSDYDLNISGLKLRLNKEISPVGLWLGNYEFYSPEIYIKNSVGKSFVFSEIESQGDTKENNLLLSGTRELQISKLTTPEKSIGPIHILFNFEKINAEAILKLIEEYRNVLETGEYYRDQLRDKIFFTLPKIFNANSEIDLKKLSIVTPNGHIYLNGKVYWPEYDISFPKNLNELIQYSSINSTLQISPSIMNEMIQEIAGLPYFYQMSRQEQDRLNRDEKEIQFAGMINSLVISDMVNQKKLPENKAVILLMLQREGVSSSIYLEFIRAIYLKKIISRETAWQLYMAYTPVKIIIDDIQIILSQNALDIEKRVYKQFYQWLKEGFIEKESQDYIIHIQRENDVMKVGNKILKN